MVINSINICFILVASSQLLVASFICSLLTLL